MEFPTRPAGVALILALFAAHAGAEGEATWNQFRGPQGRGMAVDEAPLPTALDPARDALPAGHTVLFASASATLNDLAAQDGPSAPARKLRR